MIIADITIEVDAGALLLLPLILLIGWFAARMLGVRQTWFRTFVTGFLGWVSGVLIAGVSVGSQPSTSELVVRVIIFSVLATMAVAIALDFIAKPGARRRSCSSRRQVRATATKPGRSRASATSDCSSVR